MGPRLVPIGLFVDDVQVGPLRDESSGLTVVIPLEDLRS